MSAKSDYDIRQLGAISVTRLVVSLFFLPDGRMQTNTFLANETRKIWVFPGKYARVETAIPGKTTTTTIEIPISPLGWEYEEKG
jgi:hypothetical protein